MRRLIRMLCVEFHKKINSYAPISPAERRAIIITSKLLNDKTSEILMCPTNDKYYIKYDDGRIFIIFNTLLKEINIINHKYDYNIKLSSRVTVSLYRKFIKEIEERRAKMEDDYRINVKNSLDSIIENINVIRHE